MNWKSASYWTTTTVTAFVFLSGGTAYLIGLEAPRRGMAALGYPMYFVALLGVWKVLGGIAILAPRLPRLKEWAYAGIAFDLSGAAVSHFAVGDPAAKVIAPLVFLAMAAASWALRPHSRVLRAGHGWEPATSAAEGVGTMRPLGSMRPAAAFER
jgi:uncharacterized membrane protein YphA (DoxX/SURF4 family)